MFNRLQINEKKGTCGTYCTIRGERKDIPLMNFAQGTLSHNRAPSFIETLGNYRYVTRTDETSAFATEHLPSRC